NSIRLTYTIPIKIKIPKPVSMMEKKRSKSWNAAGYRTRLINTGIGATIKSNPASQPDMTNATSAKNGPKTIAKLKNPKLNVAQAALIILLAEKVSSA